MTVKNITLLSVEEYQKYKSVIPLVDDWWWLRSPGYIQSFAAYVDTYGDINMRGIHVNFGSNAIHPALRLNLEFSDTLFWYKPEKIIGTKINYGKYQWTILDTKLGEIYVLCDNIIAEHRFDHELNNWDKSELKQWLETEGLKLITL